MISIQMNDVSVTLIVCPPSDGLQGFLVSLGNTKLDKLLTGRKGKLPTLSDLISRKSQIYGNGKLSVVDLT